MYNDTITLFNRKTGERGKGDTWYPTIIKNVNVNIDRAAILAKYGAESQDSAYIGIRYDKRDSNIIVAGKPWMAPKQWDGTEDSITFAAGTSFDFFLVGEWIGGISSDEDYDDEGFYGYMNRTRDYVFAISSVAIHTVLPLIEVFGK